MDEIERLIGLKITLEKTGSGETLKATQIEQSDIGDLLANIVFSEIIRDNKIGIGT